MTKTNKNDSMAIYGFMFFVAILLSIAGLFLTSWVLMLLLGALSTFTAIPALGYWQTVLVVLALELVVGIIKAVKA